MEASFFFFFLLLGLFEDPWSQGRNSLLSEACISVPGPVTYRGMQGPYLAKALLRTGSSLLLGSTLNAAARIAPISVVLDVFWKTQQTSSGALWMLSGWVLNYYYCFAPTASKVWPSDRQPQHCLGAWERCKSKAPETLVWVSTVDPQNQRLATTPVSVLPTETSVKLR